MLPALVTKELANTNIIGWLLKGGFFLAIAGATFLLFRSVIRKVRRNSITNNFGADTPEGRAALYATNLYQALFPSGLEWFSDFLGDATDETLIFSTAHKIHEDSDISDVVKAYRKLYQGRDLIIDLQKDMGSTGFAKFNKIVNEGLSGIRLNNSLVSSRPTVVYDEKNLPIGSVRPRTNFGLHLYSLAENNGRMLHGFDYEGQMRFVNAEDVQLVRNRKLKKPGVPQYQKQKITA